MREGFEEVITKDGRFRQFKDTKSGKFGTFDSQGNFKVGTSEKIQFSNPSIQANVREGANPGGEFSRGAALPANTSGPIPVKDRFSSPSNQRLNISRNSSLEDFSNSLRGANPIQFSSNSKSRFRKTTQERESSRSKLIDSLLLQDKEFGEADEKVNAAKAEVERLDKLIRDAQKNNRVEKLSEIKPGATGRRTPSDVFGIKQQQLQFLERKRDRIKGAALQRVNQNQDLINFDLETQKNLGDLEGNIFSIEEKAFSRSIQNPLAGFSTLETEQRTADRDAEKNRIEFIRNTALASIEAEEKAAANRSIRESTSNLKGSKAAREAITSAITRDENRRAEERIAERRSEVEQQVTLFQDQERRNEKINKTSLGGVSQAELAQQEREAFIENRANQIQQQDPTKSFFVARAEALRIASQMEAAPKKADKIQILADQFSDPGFRQQVQGNEIELAFNSLGGIKEAESFVRNNVLLPEREVQKQIKELRRAQNPHLDESQFGEVDEFETNLDIFNTVIGDGAENDPLGVKILGAVDNLSDGEELIARGLWSQVQNSPTSNPAQKSLASLKIREIDDSISDSDEKSEFSFSDLEFNKKGDVLSVGRSVFGSKISDTEGERIFDFVTDPEAQGFTRFDLIQEIAGFKIDSEKNKDLAGNLIDTIIPITGEDGLSSFDVVGLSSLINRGQKTRAINKVERFISGKARKEEGDNFVSESFTKKNVKKSNEVIALLDKIGDESPVGVIEGTIEDFLGRFRGEESAEINAAIVDAVAEFRNELLGSAVTPGESAFLEPLIPKLGDSPDNFVTKLNRIRNGSLINLNSQRSTYGLPELTEKQLLDGKLRVGLYDSGFVDEELVSDLDQNNDDPKKESSEKFKFNKSEFSPEEIEEIRRNADESILKQLNLESNLGESFVSKKFAGRNVTLAPNAFDAFEKANEKFKKLSGSDIVIGAEDTSSLRTEEQQQKLYGQGRTAEELRIAGVDDKFAQPEKPIVTKTLNSRHNQGLAVDLFPFEIDIGGETFTPKEYIAMVKPFLEAEGFKQDTAGIGDFVNFEFL